MPIQDAAGIMAHLAKGYSLENLKLDDNNVLHKQSGVSLAFQKLFDRYFRSADTIRERTRALNAKLQSFLQDGAQNIPNNEEPQDVPNILENREAARNFVIQAARKSLEKKLADVGFDPQHREKFLERADNWRSGQGENGDYSSEVRKYQYLSGQVAALDSIIKKNLGTAVSKGVVNLLDSSKLIQDLFNEGSDVNKAFAALKRDEMLAAVLRRRHNFSKYVNEMIPSPEAWAKADLDTKADVFVSALWKFGSDRGFKFISDDNFTAVKNLIMDQAGGKIEYYCLKNMPERAIDAVIEFIGKLGLDNILNLSFRPAYDNAFFGTRGIKNEIENSLNTQFAAAGTAENQNRNGINFDKNQAQTLEIDGNSFDSLDDFMNAFDAQTRPLPEKVSRFIRMALSDNGLSSALAGVVVSKPWLENPEMTAGAKNYGEVVPDTNQLSKSLKFLGDRVEIELTQNYLLYAPDDPIVLENQGSGEKKPLLLDAKKYVIKLTVPMDQNEENIQFSVSGNCQPYTSGLDEVD